MPKYIVTCEGALEVGRQDFPTGSTVELSEEKANSLPPGTVKLAPIDPASVRVDVLEGLTPESATEEPEHHSKKKGNRR